MSAHSVAGKQHVFHRKYTFKNEISTALSTHTRTHGYIQKHMHTKQAVVSDYNKSGIKNTGISWNREYSEQLRTPTHKSKSEHVQIKENLKTNTKLKAQ